MNGSEDERRKGERRKGGKEERKIRAGTDLGAPVFNFANNRLKARGLFIFNYILI